MSTCAAAEKALRDFLANGNNTFKPIFAMKKYTSAPSRRGLPEEVGFLAAGRGTKLYLANIFVLVGGPLAPQLEKLPSKDYPSVEALFADGWEVD